MTNSYLHYNIIEKLGEGGMGMVYLARDTKLDRNVALKFLSRHISLDPVEKKRFLQEAQAAAALNHPNIAQVYAVEEVGDEMFIVMEFIDGKELRDVIREGTLTIEERTSVAIQIARGLQAAHSRGIIHRDIKSGNIMLTAGHDVKIMDFGLARMEGASHITRAGTTIGTVAYMSPEQLSGHDVDHRSDIWAFGVVLYELFCGELPFQGVYEPAIMYAITEEEPIAASTLNENVPERMATIINGCLQKDRNERYQNFDAVLADMEEGSSEPGKQAVQPGRPKKKRPNARHWYISLPAALIVLFMAFFLIGKYTDLRWYGAGSVPIPEEQGLAILPFTNISNLATSELGILSDGLMMSLTSKLTQVSKYRGSLWVISASEIIQGGVQSPSQARREYSVNLALTGSLQEVDNHIVLTMNLIDTKTLRQLNSREVESTGDNLTRLPALASNALLDMLNIELQPEITQAVAEVEGDNQSSQFYIKGQGYLLRYEQADNLDKAIHAFKQTVARNPDNAAGHAALGESYWRKYQMTEDVAYVEEAKSALTRAMEVDSTLVQVISTLGLINRGTGDYDQAITNFQQVITRDPNNDMAFRQLASTYIEKGELDKAEANFKVAIQLKPEYWKGYSDLGNFYLQYRGDIDKAIEMYRHVLEHAPENYIGLSRLGAIYIYQEKFEEGIRLLEQSMRIKETYFAASNLGVAYYYLENYSEAIRWYTAAYELNAGSYRVLGNIASAHEAIGNQDLAVSYYKKAIDIAREQLEVNPNNVRIINDLGSYYADIGANMEALQYLKRSLALNADNNEILFYTAAAYERMGDRENALKWMEQAVKKGYSVSNIISQPELKSLTGDPGFKAMVAKYEDKAQ